MYTPNGTIEVFKGVKLNEGAEDTLHFATRDAQNTYFGTTIASQRLFREDSSQNINWDYANSTVKVKCPYATLQDANYIRFKNPDVFGDKWIYAFATPILTSNSAAVTELRYIIDDMQTWLAGVDYYMRECYVEREHQLVSDNIGDNTVNENIGRGDVHFSKNENFNPYFTSNDDPDYYIVLLIDGYTSNLNVSPVSSKVLDKISCDCVIALFDANDSNALADFNTVLHGSGTQRGVGEENIVAMYCLPKSFVKTSDLVTSGITFGNPIIAHADTLLTNALADSINWTPVGHDGKIYDGSTTYTPKNKKLLTAPFCFYSILTPTGNELKTDYARFATTGNEPSFKIYGSLVPPAQVTLMPTDYCETTHSTDKVAAFPPLFSGIYNGGDLKTRLQSLLVPASIALMGVATGNINTVAGASQEVINSSQDARSSTRIDTSSANVALANDFYTYQGRQGYVENYKAIDDFFEAYGYAQNKRMTPFIGGRQRWTYVKTRDASHEAVSIPAEAMKRINEKFNKGIRFHESDITIGSLMGYTNPII